MVVALVAFTNVTLASLLSKNPCTATLAPLAELAMFNVYVVVAPIATLGVSWFSRILVLRVV